MNDKDLNLIEKYIDGELYGSELTIFEKRLKTDKLLFKEYNKRIKFAKLWVDADDYSKTKAKIADILHKKEVSFFQANRYLIFSIAASLIILASVYFLIVQKTILNENGVGNQFADVPDSITTKENTVVFKYDDPVKLASIDSISDNIQLLYPSDGVELNILEPITFKWISDSNTDDTLFVCNQSDMKVLLKLRVSLVENKYTIKYPQFTKGSYLWYISNSNNSKEFSIIEE